MASKTQALTLHLLLPLLLLFHFNSSLGCPIVTYWGQNTGEADLRDACDTKKYEIINIAFLNTFGSGQNPGIDLADHCGTSYPRDCTGYDSQIEHCQSLGVKIFLSLGGAFGSYNLSSRQDAKAVADYLWTYYLSGNNTGLLGKVKLDGIDFDIEAAASNSYWQDLFLELYEYKVQREFYLSAAPQCPIPDYYLDAAIRFGQFDYIWVKFYNNASCEYTNDGDTQKLISSWNQWTSTFTATKFFYVGLPASPAANGSAGGYVPIDVLNSEILPEVETSSKFGGVMLWNHYYDEISEYSNKINCTAPPAFNVRVREPLVAMMKSA